MLARGFMTLLLIALGVAVARGAAAENEADCADLSLRFEAEDSLIYCYAGTSKGRDAGQGPVGWSGDWQMMYANSATAARAVAVIIGNSRTYIEAFGVRERIEEARWFDLISDWGEPYKLDSYEVVRFDALWGEMKYAWHCAGFTRYARPFDLGYREALKGYFCIDPDSGVEEQTLREFLASISY